jgi:hypothetical protein
MRSKVRDAAGLLIEQGRALGALDEARLLAAQCTRTASAAREAGETKLAELMDAHAKSQLEAIPVYERLAVSAKQRAEELMTEIEHPGAVLARRLVATYRAARAGWRGAR